MSLPKSTLGLFNDKLIAFFQDLYDSYPEERDIKAAIEALQGAKKINPRLILDMFIEHVRKPLREDILSENDTNVIDYAKKIISTSYNEMLSALMIFDKHWPDMSDANRKAIWNYLKVLVILSEKVRA
uniref:Uncharacterized protein n=1 Tax=viral metagenome TaxID=1070528 RepID=A0A6C0KM87_9ZZZZ